MLTRFRKSGFKTHDAALEEYVCAEFDFERFSEIEFAPIKIEEGIGLLAYIPISECCFATVEALGSFVDNKRKQICRKVGVVLPGDIDHRKQDPEKAGVVGHGKETRQVVRGRSQDVFREDSSAPVYARIGLFGAAPFRQTQLPPPAWSLTKLPERFGASMTQAV